MLEGDSVQARQQYETALKLDPGCNAAKQGVQELTGLVAHLQTTSPKTITPVSAPVEPVPGIIIPASLSP
jgi:hypothetical protein